VGRAAADGVHAAALVPEQGPELLQQVRRRRARLPLRPEPEPVVVVVVVADVVERVAAVLLPNQRLDLQMEP